MKPGSTGRSYDHFRKLTAIVQIVAFMVAIAAGLSGGVRITTIIYRSFIVIIAIGVISRVVIGVMAGYEEINSGKT